MSLGLVLWFATKTSRLPQRCKGLIRSADASGLPLKSSAVASSPKKQSSSEKRRANCADLLPESEGTVRVDSVTLVAHSARYLGTWWGVLGEVVFVGCSSASSAPAFHTPVLLHPCQWQSQHSRRPCQTFLGGHVVMLLESSLRDMQAPNSMTKRVWMESLDVWGPSGRFLPIGAWQLPTDQSLLQRQTSSVVASLVAVRASAGTVALPAQQQFQ
eukprot:5621924-Amphidinium_carterae.1